jgi:hypothetical protein
MSPELRLIVAPRATYAALRRAPVAVSPLAALRRPAIAAVVLGVSVAIAASGRATPALVISTTITWSYVVLVQIAIALAVIAPAARRTIGLARALDLFFAGHAPWSLFLLGAAAITPLPPGWPARPLALLALVPFVLTLRIVAAFFVEVLAMERRTARRMTILHQGVTWTVFVAVNWLASAITPRILELWL